MASEEEKHQQGDSIGFEGLSSMVSDVDATLASTPTQSQSTSSDFISQQSARASQPAHREESKPIAETHQAPAQHSGGSSTGKWLLGIAAVIGIIWLASQLYNSTPSPAHTPGTSSTSAAPARTPASAPAWQPPVAQPQALSGLIEEKPSVGRNNLLSTVQIKYCLAEKIRLDAADTVINTNVNSDVNRFNEYVDDYNSRCGQFRYQQGALESARRDVEPYRDQLQAEGRGRFFRGPSATNRPAASAQLPQLVEPTPEATVQAIQQRLNELGYDAGPVDGLPGARTRAAILAFQQENGLVADGIASQALLLMALTTLSRLSVSERQSIEAACATEKYVNGQAAYNLCLSRQRARFKN